MPSNVNLTDSNSEQQFTSFISLYKLNDLIESTDSGDFQDAKINFNSFLRPLKCIILCIYKLTTIVEKQSCHKL